jgi:peroxiredoxin
MWTSIPISRLTVDTSAANRPRVAVPKPGEPQERLEIQAHVSPWAADGMAGGTANFVVHFPDDQSSKRLSLLPRVLAESGRQDTATAILCVLTPAQLSSALVTEGVMYADDSAAWERLLGVNHRPATVVLNPAGKTVWRHEGEIGERALAEALRGHLAAGGQFFPQFIDSPLRSGDLPPNFVFKSSSGDRVTLRMLAGKPVALIFWNGFSTPSVAALKSLRQAAGRSGAEAPVILAIDEGGSGDGAHMYAADGEGVVMVPDPQRQIARAYGVSLWPTTIFLDSNGLVRDIRFGLIGEHSDRSIVPVHAVDCDSMKL